MTAIDEFFTHYYARRPVNATFTGVHAYDDRLPDWTLDGLAAQDDEMKALGDALAAEYPAPASVSGFRNSPDLLDAELARGFLDIQRAENASLHGPRGNPALWTGEAVFSIISLMIRDFAPLDERAPAVADRCRRIPEYLEEYFCHSERSAEGAESRNRRPPGSGAELSVGTTAIPRLAAVRLARNDIGGIPAQWTARALRDCEGASVLLTTGVDRWLATAAVPSVDAALIGREVAKARQALSVFSHRLRMVPEATEPAMACGPDLFDLLLTRGHFCTRSRSDLLTEARERFDSARSELDLLARSVAGSWAGAHVQLAANRPAPAEYFDAFDETWRACRALTENANAITWPDDWPVRYVPYQSWTADAAPFLYYLHYRSPAPFDPYTTHDYVVPPLPTDEVATDKHLRVWNHSTIKLNHVVHHGAIGHHLQNWYAYNQPRSRVGKVAAVDCANRIGMFCGGTMAEGWACYATELMDELGFLTPLERVAQQHTRVRLLARAIVDIELHQGTISFDDAVRFYAERAEMNANAARAEVVKNSLFPCTGLMYWLGTQGILDLREEMKRREGPRFSLRRFHGELLGYGSIPVPLVARMMTESVR